MIKKILSIFLIALALNWAWEILHSPLYLNYQGGPITGFILFRAALVDAFIIVGLYLLAKRLKFNISAVILLGGFLVSAVIEIWALHSGRWAYASAMPIIPILNIGLTPAIQLAVTGMIAFKITNFLKP